MRFWVLCWALAAALHALVPPSPELKARLQRKGRWEEVKEALLRARAKGVDRPDPVRLKSFRERMRALRARRTTDTLPAVVLLADFNDNPAHTPPDHFSQMLFDSTGGQNTMRDFYLENSYGLLDILGEVHGWYRMPHNYSYYSHDYGFGAFPSNAQGLVMDAVQAADPYVDFSQFDGDGDGYVDALFVVHAGPGAEQTGDPNDIWSHRWVLPYPLQVDGVYVYDYTMEPENGEIGVFAHELGHVFGLPDLYDGEYDSEGLGNWSVMAGGSWGNGGRTPVHFDAWCKVALGFADPIEVTGTLEEALLPRVEDHPVIYKLWRQGQGGPQYFLVENRRRVLFDAYLPAEGLLIYHVDESVPGNRNQWYPGHTSSGHYKVALEQADGLWDLERNQNGGDPGDPYPGSTGNRRFDNSSWPNSWDYDFQMTHVSVTEISEPGDTMTARLSVEPVPNLGLTGIETPSGVVPADTTLTPRIRVGNFGENSPAPTALLRIWRLFPDTTLVYEETASAVAPPPGDTTVLSFAPLTLPPLNAPYRTQAVLLSGDGYPYDDTLWGNFVAFRIVRNLTLTPSPIPVIPDGVLDSTEWGDGASIDVSDVYDQDGEGSVGPGTGFLHLKQSGDTLAMGLEIRFPNSPIQAHRVGWVFDDDGSGDFPTTGEEEGELYILGPASSTALLYRGLHRDGSFGSPVPANFPMGTGTTNSSVVLEVLVPLQAASGATDPALAVHPPTHTFGLFLSYRALTPPLGYIGWYPQDIPQSEQFQPALYARITLDQLTVSQEEIALSPLRPSLKAWFTDGVLHLEGTLPPRSTYTLSLYDPLGRRRLQLTDRVRKSSLSLSLPLPNLPQGLYFLHFRTAEFRLRQRILVIKEARP